MIAKPDLSLRPIRAEEIEELLDLADESGLSPWSRQNFIDELRRSDAVMLLAVSETGRTEGFVVGRLTLGQSDEQPFEAEIYNIGVRKRSRRSGVGKALLNAFTDRCKAANAARIWLEVRLSNSGAIAFYKQLGFIEAATRRAFYSDPVEDAVVMKLEMARSEMPS